MIHDGDLHWLCFLLLLILNGMNIIIYGVQTSTKHPCVIIISLSNHCTSGGSDGRFEWIDDNNHLICHVCWTLSIRLSPFVYSRSSNHDGGRQQPKTDMFALDHMSHRTLRNWRGTPSGANGSAQEWADFLTSLGNPNLGWTLHSRERTHPLNLISAGLTG